MTTDTTSRLTKIVNEVLASNDLDKIESFKPELRLREDLGFDSLQLAELTVNIEDEFDIDIFEDGLVNTLGEIHTKLD